MKKVFLVLVAAAAIALTGCKKNIAPQTPQECGNIIVYGKIYTAETDPDKTPADSGYYKMAEAMVIRDGRFEYVGTEAGANAFKTDNSRIINCNGQGIIIPGITDGHAHYMLKYINEQMEGNTIQFNDQQNYDEVIAKVRDFVENAKKNGRHLDYVYGEGYSVAMMTEDGKDLRHRKDLDAITTDIPVYLTGFDHHSTLVNTRTMINAGIVDENDSIIRDHIAGGFMYRDDNGDLNGVFAERAISLLQGPGLNNKMRPTSTQISQGIGNMQRYLLSVGITNIIEGWTNNYSADDESLFQALTAMDASDDLHLNVSLTYEIEPWFNDNKPFCYVKNAASVQKRYQSKHVHPDYVKLFMDGCVELGTGFLLGNYPFGTTDSVFSGHGTALWTEDDMRTLVFLANAEGLSVHTHAMGDGAVHRCVVAYSEEGNDELRNSICHLRNVSPNDYPLIKRHNIAVSSNMNWHCFTAAEENYFGNILSYPYDKEAYPMQSFFEHGILVSQCTDTPADSGINYPFYCMMVAVTGAYEASSYVWQPAELINRCQFLQAATYNGAWQLHLEKERGSIKENKYADFVILDQDILTCDVQMLCDTKVLKTFFEGKEVYSR
ncbi:MAG: amidohydrolase family protein [Bacteroidales bacterium]|nr:amidohydrolase family protein [Bacteroidales bacterium]